MQTNIPLHHSTPLCYSKRLSQHMGSNIWLKMEVLQAGYSFKIRGLGRLCQYHLHNGKKSLVSSSGGNAGLATAYAAKRLGVEAHVFIPKTSKPIYIDYIQSEGANVTVAGDVWLETNKIAQEYAIATNSGFVHPFDHPLIWSGHATLIDEIAASEVQPDAIITAVGGGGLASGLLMGMANHGWFDTTLIAVETEGAASFAACLTQQSHVTLDNIDTVATSLGASRICDYLYNNPNNLLVESIVVSDAQAIDAIQRFVDDHRILIEPATAATLATCYDKLINTNRFKNIVVIVCGGVGISLDLLKQYQAKFKR